MKKKAPNTLFLDYLIENEAKFESQADAWFEGVQEKDGKSLEEISSSVNERVILQKACFGELGWCFPNFMKKHIVLGKVMADLRNGVSIDEIDSKIAECFWEREIEANVILTERLLSDSDKKKLDLAFELYLKQEYFTSAMLLAGIIDSASINQALKGPSTIENVSQCWKCYGKVIQENFATKYFTAEFPYNKNAKEDKRSKATIDFFKSIKHDECFQDKKDILIPLSFAMLKFFDDSDWTDKKNGTIPSSVNRHWLAHNMYDYDDITRADCMKLFLLLYQIMELYRNL